MAVVCVTGGAGFIGSHLVSALVARGDTVRVFDNLTTGRRENLEQVAQHCAFIAGDVLDSSAVDAAVAGADLVFHLAALPSVPLSLEQPLQVHAACATGTLAVLHAARRAKVRRLIYAGSSSAYGERHAGAQQETQRPQPLSPYAAAKLAGEAYCEAFWHSFRFPTVVLRLFNVYGERQDPSGPYSAVIPRFVVRLLRGEPLPVFGDGRQTRDFCHVADVVAAMLQAAELPEAAGQTFNVAQGRPTSLLELIEQLGQVFGVTPTVDHQPTRPGDIHDSYADLTHTRTGLRFEPRVSLAEGLLRTAAYYRQTLAR